MLSRDRAEQEILLADDHAAEPEQAQHMLDVLPKDMQKYLLTFCDVQEIGRLAQVDKKFHHLINDASLLNFYEVRRYFHRSMPDIGAVLLVQTQPGYVRGSYAQLRDFFTARASDEQRLAELEGKCCINRIDHNDPCGISKSFILYGLITCPLFTGLSTLFYLITEAPKNLMAVEIIAPFAGAGCLLCTGGAICLCAGARIVRNKNERDDLQSQLTSQPGPASLHGTMFSWQPTVVHQERVPVTLRMNE